MRKRSPVPIPPSVRNRPGSTLSEVLISMLVLAIGVTMVMYLFPLSILRVVRANSYTQSTVLRYNAEAAVRTLKLNSKSLYFGADRNPGAAGLDDDFDTIDTDTITGVTHPGPNGVLGDGDDYPVYDLDELFAMNSDDVHNILIDPIGYHRMQDLNQAAGDNWQHSYNNESNPVVLRRVSGGHQGNYGAGPNSEFSLVQAELIATLPDQLVTMFDTAIDTSTATGTPAQVNQVTLPSNMNSGTGDELAAIITGGGLVNITVFADGKGYACRVIATEDTNGNGTLDPNEDTNGNGQLDETTGLDIAFVPSLPASVVTGDVERVIVQRLQKDFTWMISARLEDRGVTPDMDVIVFKNREFEQRDEQLFDATIDDSDPGAYYTNYNIVRMTFTANNRPAARPGSWMFDAGNNYWYRVQTIRRETSTTLELLVDRSIIDIDGDNEIQAAFMRNIVDVFPIGRQQIQVEEP